MPGQEIDYKNDVLELEDGSPVTYIGELPGDNRYDFNCLVYKDKRVFMHQFDRWGSSRDMKTPKVREAREYTTWEIWTRGKLKPSAVVRIEPTRELRAHEYMIKRHVAKNGKVTVSVIEP